MPGFRKGYKPPNAGRTWPAEALTQDEVNRLMDAISRTSVTGKRNRALVWLLYRSGMRIGQVLSMERRHYQPENDTLVCPGTKVSADRAIPLDPVSRELLAEWMTARRKLGVRPTAPFFCTIAGTAKGGRLSSPQIRVMLGRMAADAGLDKRVHPDGLKKSWGLHQIEQAARFESNIGAYVDDERFRTRYRTGYEKWRDAQALYAIDPVRHATRVGHDCREALAEFASAICARYEVDVKRNAGTVDKIRAVTNARLESDSVSAFVDALIAYWGTVSDLAMRQEHGAKREKERLTSEDARRLIFQTMLVMFEVDRALALAA